MTRFRSECTETFSGKKKTLEVNNKKLILNNPKQKSIKIVKVDGCQITEGTRCDMLVLVSTENVEVFIELKGKKINKAVQQLKRSIELLGSKNSDTKRTSLIVSSRVPRVGTDIDNWRKIFRKDYNSEFVVKNSQHEIPL